MLRSLLEKTSNPADSMISSGTNYEPLKKQFKFASFSKEKRGANSSSFFCNQSNEGMLDNDKSVSYDRKAKDSPCLSTINTTRINKTMEEVNLEDESKNTYNETHFILMDTENNNKLIHKVASPLNEMIGDNKEIAGKTNDEDKINPEIKGPSEISFFVPPAYRNVVIVRELDNEEIKHTYPIIRNTSTGRTYLLLRTLLHQKKNVRILLANELKIYQASNVVGEEPEYIRTNYNVVIKITTDHQHILSNCYNSNDDYLKLPPLKENPLKEMETMLSLQNQRRRHFQVLKPDDCMIGQQTQYYNHQMNGIPPPCSSFKWTQSTSVETAKYDLLASSSYLSTKSSYATTSTIIPEIQTNFSSIKCNSESTYFATNEANCSSIISILKVIADTLSQDVSDTVVSNLKTGSIGNTVRHSLSALDISPFMMSSENSSLNKNEKILGQEDRYEKDSYVVKLLDYMQDFQNLYMVIPYYSNGDLFQLLKLDKHSKGLSNGQAKKIFRQLLMATLRMKERSICHLDLSIENIMFDENDDAVVIDFGMCYTVKPSTTVRSKNKTSTLKFNSISPKRIMKASEDGNTPPLYSNISRNSIKGIMLSNEYTTENLHSGYQRFYPSRKIKDNQVQRNYDLIGPTRRRGKGSYMCPQVALEKPIDGFAADMWSLGVILFVMCTCTPLYGKPEDAAFKTILRKGIEALLSHYETFDLKLNHYTKDLITKLINPNQDERMTLEEAFFHPWLWTDDLNKPFTDYTSDETVMHFFGTIKEKWGLLHDNLDLENSSIKETMNLYNGP